MELNITRNQGIHRISVQGEATIYGVSEAHVRLKQELMAAIRLEVDLSEVTELDSSFCQLLISVWRQGKKDEKPVEIVRHNDISREFMDALHLSFLNRIQPDD